MANKNNSGPTIQYDRPYMCLLVLNTGHTIQRSWDRVEDMIRFKIAHEERLVAHLFFTRRNGEFAKMG